MTQEEKNRLNDGFREPDIVKEGKAALACLGLFLCAVFIVGMVFGVVWLITEIIKSLC